MDEMKLKLSTRLMRGVVSKIIKRSISKKLGYDIDVHVNEINLKNIDGNIHIHIDVDSEVNNKEFIKILKDVGLD